MRNWIIPRLEFFLSEIKMDFNIISKKNKNDEWKRDHYRYAFTVRAQGIFKLLNTSITNEPISQIQPSTKNELMVLRDMIDEMINE